MARNRFVTPETVRLSISDGDWIDVKKELTAGEERNVFTSLVKTMHAGERAELDPKLVGITQLMEYILGWSFVDDDGHPVLYSPSKLDSLDAGTYAEISEALDRHIDQVMKEREIRKNGLGTPTASEATLPSVVG